MSILLFSAIFFWFILVGYFGFATWSVFKAPGEERARWSQRRKTSELFAVLTLGVIVAIFGLLITPDESTLEILLSFAIGTLVARIFFRILRGHAQRYFRNIQQKEERYFEEHATAVAKLRIAGEYPKIPDMFAPESAWKIFFDACEKLRAEGKLPTPPASLAHEARKTPHTK